VYVENLRKDYVDSVDCNCPRNCISRGLGDLEIRPLGLKSLNLWNWSSTLLEEGAGD
jgi:hypothetical protein